MAWFWIVKPIVLPPLQIYLLCFDGSTILEENPIVLDMTANGPYSRGPEETLANYGPLALEIQGLLCCCIALQPLCSGFVKKGSL